MKNDPIVIVSIARTPQGNLLGVLKDASAVDLGATVIRAAIERGNLQPSQIDEVIMGCVLPAGLGQAPARQAAIKAKIPNSVGATTINKMCGSGMKAVMFAHDLIQCGHSEIVIAGGMESMTNAPYLIDKARSGYRLGHGKLIDHMYLDGLEDAYDKGKLMGYFAEQTAKKYHFTREIQDEFAKQSLTRAQNAIKNHLFDLEITPVTLQTRQGEVIVKEDENPLKAKIEKIAKLPPAFIKDGTITAANSSSISDGAAALVLMRASKAKELRLTPLAKICAMASHAQAPQWYTTAPVSAIKKVLATTGWNHENVDLYEINEAFAVVTLVAMQELNLPLEKVNIHGGACALGHPIGASGARLIVTLLAALKQLKMQRGIAALCIGGGEATAMAFELY